MPTHSPRQRKDARVGVGAGPLFEELEPRLLLSADWAGVVDTVPAVEPAIVQRIDVEPAATSSTGAAAGIESRSDLVLIDPRIADYGKLVSDLLGPRSDGREIEVLVLDPERDGVQQVSEALAERRDLSALHVLSHGADGNVGLGATQLNFESLLANATAIKQWGAAFTAEADIMLYGCNVAASSDGQSLIDALSRLTGADVAASDDPTGDAALGGDWRLEVRTGAIETLGAVSEAVQAQWNHLLAAPVITSNGGGATAAVSIAENSTAATTVTATDADGNPLSYSISGGVDASLFSINSSTGALRFLVAPNFESARDADANNVYEVTVQVSDGTGGTDTQAISVTVTNVNEAPTGGGSHNYYENLESYGDVVASGVTRAGDWIAGAGNQIEIQKEHQFFGNGGTNRVMEIEGPVGGDRVYRDFATSTGEKFTLSVSYSPRPVALNNSALDVYWEGALVGTLNAGASGFQTYTFNLTANSGSGASRLEFRAQDANSEGGLIDNVSLQLNGLNDSQQVTTAEDVAYAFAAVDFIFTDPDAGDTLSAVRIDTLPGAGTLTLSGAAVAAGQVIAAADIAAGNLVFTPAANANGSPYASFTYSVRDAGGLYDPAPNTLTINVTAVNDAPVVTSNGGGASAAVSIAENTTTVTTVTATDVELDSLTYSITGGADAARFTIDASTGALSFSAAPNFESPGDADTDNVYDVTVQVSDGNGGTDTQAIAVTITNANEAPAGTDAAVSTNEDTAYTFAIANFGFSDADAGDSLSAVRIDTLPATGTLALSGVAVAAGQVIAAADITAGNLVYTPAANANGSPYASFTYSVRDAGGLFDPAPNTMTINVTAVNDAPVVTSDGGAATASVSVAENTQAVTTVTASDIDVPANALSYSIVGGADSARFTINSATGALSFLAAPNFESPGDADADNVYEVTVQVSDGNGGTDTQAISVSVTNVNDAPVVATNIGTTVTESTTITSSQLETTDADNAAAQLVYTLTSVPTGGVLQLDGVTLNVNDTFTQADLNANRVTYRHIDPTVSSDSFGFVVSDGAGGAAGPDSFAITATLAIPSLSPAAPPAPPAAGSPPVPPPLMNAPASPSPAAPPEGGLESQPPYVSSGPAVSPAAPAAVAAPAASVGGSEPTAPGPELPAKVYAFQSLGRALDELRRDMEQNANPRLGVATVSAVGGAALTVGFVSWLLRSGALVSSLLATAPLWARFDPVPILAGRRRDKEQEREEGLKDRLAAARDRSERALRRLFGAAPETPAKPGGSRN